MTEKIPTTESDADPNAISMQTAQEFIFSSVPAFEATQTIQVAEALGRVCAEDLVSPMNVPSFRASAMDGYAFRHSEGHAKLTIAGHSLAGHPSADNADENACVRITTGARVPDFADTVVQQENVSVQDGVINIEKLPVVGHHIRQPGSDSSKNSPLLAAGQVLGAAQIAVLISHGIVELTVLRKIKVAVFSTGDELVEAGDNIPAGCIVDANRALLSGLLCRPAIEIIDLGIVKDSEEALHQAFANAKNADVTISSGGVSVGDADFVRTVLEQHGDLQLWKIAMKPGRPLTFGKLSEQHPYFGLPGNPVSAAVTCVMFVLPAIQRMLGQPNPAIPKIRATLASNVSKLPGRIEYQRGFLQQENDSWVVSTTGLQDSHVISSLHKANCFVELGVDSEGASIGEEVSVVPFQLFADSPI
jgi:molybdopterin molybdotransferase